MRSWHLSDMDIPYLQFLFVDTDGSVVGLKKDYSLVKNHDADGFQLELRNSIKHFLKNNIINDLFDVQFQKYNSEDICEIIVHPSPTPVILTYDGKEKFYVREGNSTKRYSLTQAIDYCIAHFTSENAFYR